MSTDLKEGRGGSSEEGTCEGRLRIQMHYLSLLSLRHTEHVSVKTTSSVEVGLGDILNILDVPQLVLCGM